MSEYAAFAAAASVLVRRSGLGTNELTRKCGAAQGHVSRILNGQRRPTRPIVAALIEALEVGPVTARHLYHAAGLATPQDIDEARRRLCYLTSEEIHEKPLSPAS